MRSARPSWRAAGKLAIPCDSDRHGRQDTGSAWLTKRLLSPDRPRVPTAQRQAPPHHSAGSPPEISHPALPQLAWAHSKAVRAPASSRVALLRDEPNGRRAAGIEPNCEGQPRCRDRRRSTRGRSRRRRPPTPPVRSQACRNRVTVATRRKDHSFGGCAAQHSIGMLLVTRGRETKWPPS